MKRRHTTIIAAVLILAACGGQDDASGPTQAPSASWRAPPTLDATRRTDRGLVVSGAATPDARVVMVASSGPAYASAVGEDGRFEIRLSAPSGPQLYRIEAQSGAAAAAAPGWLFVAPNPLGVSAMLAPGEATRVLEGRRPIAAVDYDGRDALVSGWAAPGSVVKVTLHPSDLTTETRADGGGRFRARLMSVPPGPRVVSVEAAGQAASAAMLLSPPVAGPLSVVTDGEGVRLSWSLPGDGGQTTWIAIGESR